MILWLGLGALILLVIAGTVGGFCRDASEADTKDAERDGLHEEAEEECDD